MTTNKVNIILTEEFLQHNIEVTINESPQNDLQFIPEEVKREVINQLSDASEGEFISDQTGDYTGTWRIVRPLDFDILVRVVMWKYNHYTEESLTEELFIKYFGKNDGKHFYSKWQYTIQFDFMEMVAYFRSNGNKGQIFCKMVMEQVVKYENREKQCTL